MIANLLDYTTSVLPVTVVDQEIDRFDTTYKPFSDLDETVWKSCMSGHA